MAEKGLKKVEENSSIRIARLEEKMASAEKAIETARISMEKRLDGMNEFREQLKDQASKFPTRSEILGFVSTAMFLTIGVITLFLKFINK